MKTTTKRLLVGGGGVLAAGLIAAAAVGLGGPAPVSDATGSGLPPATVEVVETTLTQTQTVSGTLSYGAPVALPSQSSGVVTWVAPPGTPVAQGEAVYRVNDQPVILIHGSIPPFRTLAPGMSGADVAQLEAALTALGYGGFSVDDYYGWGTAAAVSAWQAALGVEQTGVVDAGQIVVAAGDIRIAAQEMAAGGTVGPGQPVVAYSGDTRVVTVALDVAKQHYVAVGDIATVTLPDGAGVEGTVSSIGTVATTADDGTTTIEVVVAIADQEALGAFDSAPVTVHLVTGTATDVLAVPVNALVALTGGGFGLEVLDDDGVDYVAVTTGMFAGGQVEVSGTGIAEGTVVGVAK